MNFTRISTNPNTIEESLYKQALGNVLEITPMPSRLGIHTSKPLSWPVSWRQCGTGRHH
jgi:hypothetical protein